MAISNDTVLDAALELARIKGWEQVSVRMVAKEIGYSTIKIYSAFGSKEQMLFEIQKKGFGKLKAAYQNATTASDDPETSLEKIATAHVKFALTNPNYYELMFEHKFNNCKSKAAEIRQEVCTIFRDAIEDIGVRDVQTAFLQLLAMLYGYIKIKQDFIDGNDSFPQPTVKQLVSNFIYGIK